MVRTFTSDQDIVFDCNNCTIFKALILKLCKFRVGVGCNSFKSLKCFHKQHDRL